MHTNGEHGRTTLFGTPKLITATALQIAISMLFPSINVPFKFISPGGTKIVVRVGPSRETGIISIIGGEIPSPVTSSTITAPSKLGGGNSLITCSLDSSVVDSEKNSSGSSIKRLIEASWPPPPVPPPQ
ncbi:MAG: hypothetical protein ACREOW_05900 [Thermodesulfobacteriota bacterium]